MSRHATSGRPRRLARWAPAACLLALSVLLPATACARQAPPLAEAREALRTGKYDAALSAFARLSAAEPSNAAARRGWVAALAEVGRYDEAAEAARAGGVELANSLGEALRARGDVAGAEAAFRAAIDGGAEDALSARLNLAVLLFERGERAEAMQRFDAFVDVYNRGGSLSAADLSAVGTAVQYLGLADPQLFHDALKAYDEAIAADPADPEPRVRLGMLFIDKYNSPDAQATLQEVLARNPRHPRALLGMARAKHFDGAPESLSLVDASLETNPNLVPARLLRARMFLDEESDAEAEAEIRAALEVNPASLEALSMLAGLHFLRGETAEYETAVARVLRLNPRYASLFATVGELAVRRRRYREASELARRAVALDSTSWSAYNLLGLNEMRLGRPDDARRDLERSFRGDPFNVWTKNTLDLLDTYPRYRSVATPRFELFLRGDEADLLSLYAGSLAEEAYDSLSRRYGYRPEAPVRVEFFPSHADFSVRTVGLAGLGALGVSFGNVLALDSPSAREKGEFNWGSTLWHEIAHAVTLGASGHRVPRWFTEGLSVREERRARPGWGSETGLGFLLAYAEGDLPRASELGESFVRPTSPEQLAHAYHHASLVVEWIEETHGFEAIRAMLRGYGEGRSTEALMRSVLGTDPAAFDRDFDAWLRARFADRMQALGRIAPGMRGAQLAQQLGEAQRQMRAGDLDEAKRSLERVAELFPDAGGESSPYAMLAEIHLEQGDPRAAAEALEKLTLLDENAFDQNVKLAEILESLDDPARAAAALERAVYIYPLEVALHEKLAALYERTGDGARSVRERRAVVALDPVDRAGALYRLAVALEKAGDREAARREVLRALEEAPSFPEAQELLLRLSGGAR